MTDVFNKEETPTQQNPLAADDKIAQLVGEGKKYANEQEALKALVFAQEHISHLEGEMAGLRSDLDKRLGAEEILTKLNAQEGATQEPLGDSTPASSEMKSGLTEDDVFAVVNKIKAEEVAQANKSEANDYVIKTFGDKAKETVANRASELGMSLDQLQAIAEKSPTAFKALITGQQAVSAPVTTTETSQSIDSQFQSGHTAPHGTKAYYDQLRAKDPKTYWQPATQRELHAAAIADPTKFFGT